VNLPPPLHERFLRPCNKRSVLQSNSCRALKYNGRGHVGVDRAINNTTRAAVDCPGSDKRTTAKQPKQQAYMEKVGNRDRDGDAEVAQREGGDSVTNSLPGNRGGARNFCLRDPKIQGIWMARDPQHPDKIAGTARLPEVRQVDGGGTDPLARSRP